MSDPKPLLAQLETIQLGNLDTTHDKRTVATILCPGHTVVSRLDIQVYSQRGFPESPYPSGANVSCSDGSRSHLVNVWPPDMVGPKGKVDMVPGIPLHQGIRNVTVSASQYVHSIGYGPVVAGRSELGIPWAQADMPRVRNCLLKGITFVYAYWFDGLKLHFDCRHVPGATGPDGDGPGSSLATTTTTTVLEWITGAVALVTLCAAMAVMVHLIGHYHARHAYPRPWRPPPMAAAGHDWVTSARAHAKRYARIASPLAVGPAHGQVPVHQPLVGMSNVVVFSAHIAHSGSPLAHWVGDRDSQHGPQVSELADHDKDDVANPDQQATLGSPSSGRQSWLDARAGRGWPWTWGRRTVEQVEALYLPTSHELHVVMEELERHGHDDAPS